MRYRSLRFRLDRRRVKIPKILSLHLSIIHPRLEDEDVRKLNGHKDGKTDLPKRKFKEYMLVSRYIPNRDGLKLAADIYFPSVHGKIDETPKPVIWSNQRYHRRIKSGLVEFNMSFFLSEWAEELLDYGYIVAVIDVRGSGASYGTSDRILSDDENHDGYDICEWFAEQPWCDGNVGMFGQSYVGACQMTVASKKPPHLKALTPEVPFFDLYAFAYPNGVFRSGFLKYWSGIVEKLDKLIPAPRVDADRWRRMYFQARRQHRYNQNIYKMVRELPFRDDVDQKYGVSAYSSGPSGIAAELHKTDLPCYFVGGWRDIFTDQVLLAWLNWGGPKKLIMGPWDHKERFSGAVERLKWFEHWLKGDKNPVMREMPIYYYTLGDGSKTGWKASKVWPVKDAVKTPFYLERGESGTVQSINDGFLKLKKPSAKEGKDEYVVDFKCTSGITSRWILVDIYLDMNYNDIRGLTWTTEPLQEDTEVTGHPFLELWVSSYDPDFNIFAYLEDVSPAGYSQYVSEGMIRATYRKESKPPYKYFDLPFHSGLKSDVEDFPKGEPTLVRFDLLPVSYCFKKGNHIRLTITGCDKDNYLTVKTNSPPKFSIHRSAKHPSTFVLPVVK